VNAEGPGVNVGGRGVNNGAVAFRNAGGSDVNGRGSGVNDGASSRLAPRRFDSVWSTVNSDLCASESVRVRYLSSPWFS